MSRKKSVQRENRTQKDRKNSGIKDLYSKMKEKLSTVWGIIGLGLSLIGSGFAAGRYYEHTQNTLEHNDKILELNKELFNVKEDYDKVVHELRTQIYELQNELINQKNHNNEKKD